MKAIRAFGVELELNGRMRADGMGRFYLTDRAGYHNRETKTIALPPGWKFVADGSCGMEFVSPPILDTVVIRRFIQMLHDSAIPKHTTFDNCGLHVHVGAMDLLPEEILNVGRFCRYFDRAIYSFFDKARRKNDFCKPITMNDARIKAMVDHPSDVARYMGCNLNAMARHGTIEFRYSEGHLDIEKIEAMVDLFTRIVEFGRHGQRLNCRPNLQAKREYLMEFLGVRPETKCLLLRSRLVEQQNAQELV